MGGFTPEGAKEAAKWFDPWSLAECAYGKCAVLSTLSIIIVQIWLFMGKLVAGVHVALAFL